MIELEYVCFSNECLQIMKHNSPAYTYSSFLILSISLHEHTSSLFAALVTYMHTHCPEIILHIGRKWWTFFQLHCQLSLFKERQLRQAGTGRSMWVCSVVVVTWRGCWRHDIAVTISLQYIYTVSIATVSPRMGCIVCLLPLLAIVYHQYTTRHCLDLLTGPSTTNCYGR